MKNITLSITKKNFYLILYGLKNKEYRNYSKYYERIFRNKIDQITFHFFSKEKLIVDVIKIEVIDTPKELELIKTDKCFQIFIVMREYYDGKTDSNDRGKDTTT